MLRALSSVVQGISQIEDFAASLVGSAVEYVLLCVARDYGHDYAVMVAAYKESMLEKYASVGGSAVTGTGTAGTCKGKTVSGKACGKRAVGNGYCKAHASQYDDEESKRRKTLAYKNVVKSSPTDDLVHTIPSSAYTIQTVDSLAFI